MKNLLILFVLFMSFGANAQVLQNQGDKISRKQVETDKATFQRDSKEIAMYKEQLLRLEDAYAEKDDKAVMFAYQAISKAMQREVTQAKSDVAMQISKAKEAQGTPAAAEIGKSMNAAQAGLKSKEQIAQKFATISFDAEGSKETLSKAKMFLVIMEAEFKTMKAELLEKAKRD